MQSPENQTLNWYQTPKRYRLQTPNRYQLAPQMRDYDAIGVNWVSYLMFIQTRGFRSASVNIDARGVRFSPRTAPESMIRLLVGGSAAFGVGASNDGTTISSFLEQKSGVRWLNFGARAYNSTQELMLYQLLGYGIDGVDRIVVFSGVNDTYLPQLIPAEGPELPVMFFGSDYVRAMAATKNPNWRQLARLILDPLVDADALLNLLRAVFLPKRKTTNGSAIDPAAAQASALAHLRRNLGLWKALADSRSIKLSFVLQPAFSWVGKPPSPEEDAIFAELDRAPGVLGQLKILDGLYEGIARGAASACAEFGINFLDVNPLIRRRSKASEWLFVDRVHLTDVGNELVADLLLEHGVAS